MNKIPRKQKKRYFLLWVLKIVVCLSGEITMKEQSQNIRSTATLIQQPLEVISQLSGGGGAPLFTCSKCKSDVTEKEFNIPQCQCKLCVSAYHKEYRAKHSEKLKKNKKEYYVLNSAVINKKSSDLYLENKDRYNAQKKIYYQKNKPDFLKRAKQYDIDNSDKVKKYRSGWRKDNKEKTNLQRKNRIKSDPLFKLSTALRSRVSCAFSRRSWKKGSANEILLGCSFLFAKQYIENLFIEHMSWDNYGEWEIDHIIALVNGVTKEELVKLCHHTNLQPLWKEDNRNKLDKSDWVLPEKYSKAR